MNVNTAPLARASSWRSRCQDVVDDFEATRVDAIQAKWQARRTTTIRTTGQWTRDRCCRVCESLIGLAQDEVPPMTRPVHDSGSLHGLYMLVRDNYQTINDL